MVDIKLDKNAIQKVIKQEMTKASKEWQAAADDIWRRYKGQPVPTVRAAIKRHRAFRDGPFDDKYLNDMAETIASGTRVEFRVK